MNFIVKLVTKLIDVIGRLITETETTGAEIAVMFHSTAWAVVIALPLTTVLLNNLSNYAPEWVWGVSFSIASFGHMCMFILKGFDQRPYSNLRMRNVICCFDAGLWSFILIIAIHAHVYFAVATSSAMVVTSIWAMCNLGLKQLHHKR